jgi:hypothetical protein
MMKFWSSDDGTGSRVEKKKTIDLSSRKIEKKRVAVINFRVNECSSNGKSSRAVHKIVNTPYITNISKFEWLYGTECLLTNGKSASRQRHFAGM